MVRLLSQEGWGTSVSLETKEKNNFELKLGTSSFVYSLMIFERYKRRGGPPQNTWSMGVHRLARAFFSRAEL